ncbi:MAG: SDR family NAD(P)-dependent oxidoreductase [Streptosporangiales bacterium]|nr:SDR family NAD(P)-dependent oxidoreductase [Streptosporangiales bacterium]
MAERTILLTGATDGLGRAVAEALAADDVRLLLHGRNERRLARTVADIRAATGNDAVEGVLADLASLDQVRGLADEVRRRTDRLDVLVNNAGIGSGEPDGRERRTSADGHELRFAVNHLAGFLLTLGLLPLLRASAPARVVNVASLGQAPLDFDDLMLERDYDGWRAYGQSKLAQILFTFELASRLPAREVTVNALHPGTFMPTKMVLRERGSSVDTLETGVASVVRLVTDPGLDGVTGRFYDRTRESRVDEQAYDPAARKELWNRSLDLTAAPNVR